MHNPNRQTSRSIEPVGSFGKFEKEKREGITESIYKKYMG